MFTVVSKVSANLASFLLPAQAKFGSKLALSHMEQITRQVQEISQNLNLEFSDLKSRGRA